MHTETIIHNLKDCSADAKRRGITSLYLFGSTAHGTMRDDSDVDVLVDYDRKRKFSLVDLAGVKHLLEDKTGRTIDIITQSGLDPALRERVTKEAIRIF